MYRTRFVDRSSASTKTMFGRVAIVPIGTVGSGADAEVFDPNVEQPASSAAATTAQAARAAHDCVDPTPDVSGSASLTLSGTLVDSPRAVANANRPDAAIGRALLPDLLPGHARPSYRSRCSLRSGSTTPRTAGSGRARLCP